MKIGFVCALRMEAATLVPDSRPLEAVPLNGAPGADAGMVMLCGMGAAAARRGARTLAGEGCDLLVSWGVAGALDAGLDAGRLLLPVEVIGCGGERYIADPSLHAAWMQALSHCNPCAAKLACAATPVMDRAGKRALREATGAAAVDMESAAVAQAATERGLSFMVLRVVLDPADRGLPRCISGAVDVFGRPLARRLCLALARRPWELPALVSLARQVSKARRGLLAAAGELPGLSRALGAAA